MPAYLHKRLESQANKKGLTGKRKQAYIYSVLNRLKRKK